jgi:hypothetical protein
MTYVLFLISLIKLVLTPNAEKRLAATSLFSADVIVFDCLLMRAATLDLSGTLMKPLGWGGGFSLLTHYFSLIYHKL